MFGVNFPYVTDRRVRGTRSPSPLPNSDLSNIVQLYEACSARGAWDGHGVIENRSWRAEGVRASGARGEKKRACDFEARTLVPL